MFVDAVREQQHGSLAGQSVQVVQGEDEAVVERRAALGAEAHQTLRELDPVAGEGRCEVRPVVERDDGEFVALGDHLLEEVGGGLDGLREAFLHRGRDVEQDGAHERRVVDPLEAEDLLGHAVFQHLEGLLAQVEQRPPVAVVDRRVELDEVDLHFLERGRPVDDRRVLDEGRRPFGVEQLAHDPDDREFPSAGQFDGDAEGFLVERGHLVGGAKDLELLQAAAFGDGDLRPHAKAVAVVMARDRFDDPDVETVGRTVDQVGVAGDLVAFGVVGDRAQHLTAGKFTQPHIDAVGRSPGREQVLVVQCEAHPVDRAGDSRIEAQVAGHEFASRRDDPDRRLPGGQRPVRLGEDRLQVGLRPARGRFDPRHLERFGVTPHRVAVQVVDAQDQLVFAGTKIALGDEGHGRLGFTGRLAAFDRELEAVAEALEQPVGPGVRVRPQDLADQLEGVGTGAGEVGEGGAFRLDLNHGLDHGPALLAAREGDIERGGQFRRARGQVGRVGLERAQPLVGRGFDRFQLLADHPLVEEAEHAAPVVQDLDDPKRVAEFLLLAAGAEVLPAETADSGARQVEPAARLEGRDAEFLARVPRPPGANTEPPVEDDRVLVMPEPAGEDRAHHLAQVLEAVEPGLYAGRRAPGTDFHVNAGRPVQQVVTRPLVVRVLEQLADHGQALAPVLPELVARRVGVGVARLPELRDEGVPLVVLGQAEEGLDLLVAEQQGDLLGPLPVLGRQVLDRGLPAVLAGRPLLLGG